MSLETQQLKNLQISRITEGLFSSGTAEWLCWMQLSDFSVPVRLKSNLCGIGCTRCKRASKNGTITGSTGAI